MRIRLDAVGGDALISLLDIAQRERGWRVAEAHIARLDGPGRVRAEIVLTAAPQ